MYRIYSTWKGHTINLVSDTGLTIRVADPELVYGNIKLLVYKVDIYREQEEDK